MVSFSYLLLALAASTSVFTAPVDDALIEREASVSHALVARTDPGTGTNNGYFYSVYSDSSVNGAYTNGPAGEYSLSWNGSGDVVVGKGWNPGGPR